MQIAIVGAGFSPGEADRLRRAMATFRHVGTIHTFREKFIAGMVRNGYDQEFAERCFNQIEGFGEYGFPESHAASFALLVYVSSWIKKHYPEVFCAAILNSQPMGFYAPAQLVRDAREHGVEVRHPDVNCSDWDCTLETGGRSETPRRASRPAPRRGRAEKPATADRGRARRWLSRPAVGVDDERRAGQRRRAARRCRRLPLDRPRPARRAVGGQGPRRRRAATPAPSAPPPPRPR